MMHRAFHLINTIAQIVALLGGTILIALVALTVISVIGRAINAYGLGPIAGDFELVENGMVCVVFCALPWCQLQFGHVRVDILNRHFPMWLSWGISLVSQCGFILLSFFVTKQLTLGMWDKLSWQETSMILQLPIWWGYAAALPAAMLWVISCIAMSWKVACAYPDGRNLG